MNEVLELTSLPALVQPPLPTLVADAGPAAAFAFDEFFSGMLRTPHTRAAYLQAVRRFLAWLDPLGTPLTQVTPGLIGRYFDAHPGSVPTQKLHLAALRRFLDVLVQRHVLLLNPAASVRGERHSVVEGKTPEIHPCQVRALLGSIDVSTPVGLRDRTILATLVYTSARDGAVAALRIKDLEHDGTQSFLRFHEKGGKQRLIPVRHDLEILLRAYLEKIGDHAATRESPLFRSAAGRTGTLTDRPLRNIDICRMMKRRLRAGGLPTHYSPHSFRVTTITDLLSQGVPLEEVQYLAGHADPRTTRLYDRRQRQVTRNLVERISI